MRVTRLRAQRSPTARPGASTAQLSSAPCTYKEHLRGCLASLNTGAGPAEAPRSPHGNLPTTPHPRLKSSTLGSPLHPQVVIFQRPGQPTIAFWQPSLGGLTPPEIISLCNLFFDFCLFNCQTHVLVISHTHYYVTLYNIIWAYYFIILLCHYTRIL